MTAAIFLLDQKITPQEFLDRVKAIALFFDGLSSEELKAIKHWIKNTTEERLAVRATEVLEASKEEVIKMVANNAFIIKEMEDNAEKKGEERGIELTKKVFKLFYKGESISNISKACNISEDEVKRILE